MNPLWILLVGMVIVVTGILLLRMPAFVALLLGALFVAAVTPPEAIRSHAQERQMSPAAAERLAGLTPGERVAESFGRTCGQIGIIIAMASIIGTCMLESGAADRIVRAGLRLLGERRAGAAFLSSGFLLGIPVFFDTVFYLMMPLGKATRVRTGRDYTLYILCIVAGATMTHSLVPPTPGPLFVAHSLGVNLALMIIGGCLVGFFAATAGYLFAVWTNRSLEIPFRESEDSLRHLEGLAAREDRQLPSTWVSLLPIVLPVALLSANAIMGTAAGATSGQGVVGALLRSAGDKNIALVLGAAVAALTLWRRTSADKTVAGIRSALVGAGMIILITSAGGAFGGALQETGIAGAVQALTAGSQVAVLPLAFALTALIRTAQGSATVAMLTAAGVFAGMADPAQLGFHPLYLALAIGCGSKPVWWMNDSGFWVVTQMSGMTEREALRTLTPIALLMGVVGLAATMLGAALFPLL